jgi:hypothetical protein
MRLEREEEGSERKQRVQSRTSKMRSAESLCAQSGSVWKNRAISSCKYSNQSIGDSKGEVRTLKASREVKSR